MAAPPDDRGMDAKLHRLFTTGESSDLIIVSHPTSGSLPQLFRVHKNVVAPQLKFLRDRMMRQGDDLGRFDFYGWSSTVVNVMVRYFYYHTLDISNEPLSVARLHFLHQLQVITTICNVEPLRELVAEHMQRACHPLEDNVEFFIAALREAGGDCRVPAATTAEAEESAHKSVRMLLQLKIVRHLPTFMIRESSRNLMEERPDILSAILPLVQPNYLRDVR